MNALTTLLEGASMLSFPRLFKNYFSLNIDVVENELLDKIKGFTYLMRNRNQEKSNFVIVDV